MNTPSVLLLCTQRRPHNFLVVLQGLIHVQLWDSKQENRHHKEDLMWSRKESLSLGCVFQFPRSWTHCCWRIICYESFEAFLLSLLPHENVDATCGPCESGQVSNLMPMISKPKVPSALPCCPVLPGERLNRLSRNHPKLSLWKWERCWWIGLVSWARIFSNQLQFVWFSSCWMVCSTNVMLIEVASKPTAHRHCLHALQHLNPWVPSG